MAIFDEIDYRNVGDVYTVHVTLRDFTGEFFRELLHPDYRKVYQDALEAPTSIPEKYIGYIAEDVLLNSILDGFKSYPLDLFERQDLQPFVVNTFSVDATYKISPDGSGTLIVFYINSKECIRIYLYKRDVN